MTATTEIGARTRLAGWPIVGYATIACLLAQAAVFALAGTGEEGVRMAIRASARTSMILFGAAFTASSLWRLRPSPASRWLLQNRRYLGVSFASSHAIHLAGIIVLGRAFGGRRWWSAASATSSSRR